MNIEQYRALKAQEAQASQTPDQTQTANTQVTEPTQTQTPAQPSVTPNQTTDTNITTQLPEKITIDGIGEVTIDELQKGYLRNKDYTQKTQEVARQRQEAQQALQVFEALRQNPQIAQQITQITPLPETLDPTFAKIRELENKLYDMMLEREIETLQGKYSDFDVREVLETAHKKQISNLEDAYLLVKSTKQPVQQPAQPNVDELKKQIRQELLKELEAERGATATIISSNDGTHIVQDNTPKLSEGEKKVARMMKLSEAEYVKWRDAGRK